MITDLVLEGTWNVGFGVAFMQWNVLSTTSISSLSYHSGCNEGKLTGPHLHLHLPLGPSPVGPYSTVLPTSVVRSMHTSPRGVTPSR
jgi:hypothetical protein